LLIIAILFFGELFTKLLAINRILIIVNVVFGYDFCNFNLFIYLYIIILFFYATNLRSIMTTFDILNMVIAFNILFTCYMNFFFDSQQILLLFFLLFYIKYILIIDFVIFFWFHLIHFLIIYFTLCFQYRTVFCLLFSFMLLWSSIIIISYIAKTLWTIYLLIIFCIHIAGCLILTGDIPWIDFFILYLGWFLQ
jgi:hypothetical protein